MIAADEEDAFFAQLAQTLQSWLGIETEIYLLYSLLMKGANGHLVSLSFHHIQSFNSRMCLLDSCFDLIFYGEQKNKKGRSKTPLNQWKALSKKAKKLSITRNRIVHWPVHTGMKEGMPFIDISPSFFDATAVIKKTAMNKDYQFDVLKLYRFSSDFKKLADDLREFRNSEASSIKDKIKSMPKTFKK